MNSMAGLLRFPSNAPLKTSRTLSQIRFISSTNLRLSDSRTDQGSPGSSKHSVNASSSSTSDNRTQQPRHDEKTKTVAQADQELRERLEKMSGGGGASGIEYEDGKPNTMKRSVRNNMFRYI